MSQSPKPTALSLKIDAAQRLLAEHMRNHRYGALHFSGGKDSTACLLLLRPWWHNIVVLWGSAGDDFPETRELMNRVKAMVPNFLVVRGNADLDQITVGWPVDMLPQNSSDDGRAADVSTPNPRLRLRYDCCSDNVWQPLMRATIRMKATLAIRGQRDDERLKNPAITEGAVVGGITYSLPVQNWTEDEVFEYLKQNGVELPKSYAYGLPSADCMHCTAYLHENQGKLRYLRDHYPAVAGEVERRLRVINVAQQAEVSYLNAVLGKADAPAISAKPPKPKCELGM